MLRDVAEIFGEFAQLAFAFGLVALVVHRRAVLNLARAASREMATNLIYFLANRLLIAPLLLLLIVPLKNLLGDQSWLWSGHGFIGGLPWWVQLAGGLLVSDFVGYWRHRLLHSRLLWPIHAIHHSDTQVNWLSLARFHPLNRLITTVLSLTALLLLGFAPWVVVLNGTVRNLYGHFIHANLPWTYGPLKYVLVSPVLHRWHHAMDRRAMNTNFATLFAFYDVAFGTFYCPHKNVGPLGVDDASLPRNWAGHMIYPFVAYARMLAPRRLPHQRAAP